MKNEYTIDTLTSVVIQEIFKVDGEVYKVRRENFEFSRLRRISEKKIYIEVKL